MKRKVALLITMVWITLSLLAACSDEAADSNAAEHKEQKKTIEKKEAPSQSSTEHELDEGENNQELAENAKKGSDNDQAKQQEQANNIETEQEKAPSQSTEQTQEEKESQADQPKITSGESAISYLRKELDMEEQEGILFDDMGGSLYTDEAGAYYRVELTSKSMQKNGGSGTVGLYKVYEDGNYESQF
ncbi:hypothetical protein [Virgibacillus sp. SK37]|uniref:hypothetical protein n=1 Tax=Virgibacillus sp. SK37 TaxID=403957 RepID=UPI0004D0DF8C|nr:hypothetical protein [Virgibacillus sp. SK37]AIF45710.1 hypothetical protein X953_19565 [Virgibacillus sp. SK37]